MIAKIFFETITELIDRTTDKIIDGKNQAHAEIAQKSKTNTLIEIFFADSRKNLRFKYLRDNFPFPIFPNPESHRAAAYAAF